MEARARFHVCDIMRALASTEQLKREGFQVVFGDNGGGRIEQCNLLVELYDRMAQPFFDVVLGELPVPGGHVGVRGGGARPQFL